MILQKRLVKRGFLRGPYCPIYGVGGIAILLVTEPMAAHPVLVFVAATLTATVLEYFTSWLLEKLFGIRWWDYTGQRFQLAGRICLVNSLLFGVMGLAVVYLVYPLALSMVAMIPPHRLRILANGLTALFLLDLITTVGRLTGFAQRLQNLQKEIQELRGFDQQYDWFDGRNLEGSLERLKALHLPELEGNALVGRLESVLEKKQAYISQIDTYRNTKAKNLSDALEAVREEYRKKKAERGTLWRKTRQIGHNTAAAGRATAKTVRGNLRYYQLFWVFLLAGVLGYLVETLYCVLTTGVVESRQGLLYGPFNQVYGFGAVLMVVVLTPLARKNDRWVFVGSALLGGGFEALCSLIQEKVFGSVSWEYSGERFAIAGGRTNLLFMFFWGILGLWFIKGLYPHLLRFIERIPKRTGRVLTTILSAALIWNMLLSAAAVVRWSMRQAGEAGESALGDYLDRRYPDEFMETVYPNMLWPEDHEP